jgi:UDP-N-acetylmuramoyl-tripeptide--D-alanyl-D-alanine ligase
MLAKAVKKDGTLILNADDEDVLNFKEYTKASTLTYSIENTADILGSHYVLSYKESGYVSGMSMRVDVAGSSIPVHIGGVLGKQQLYPILAAFAVAYSQKLNLIQVGQSFAKREIAPGRMKIIDGIHNAVIIDDTYNASPIALEEGLNTLNEIKCKGRKIAVLGDMLELGRFSSSEHKRLGEYVKDKADILVAVGIRAKDFGVGAEIAGFTKENIFYFEDARSAGEALKNMIKKDDVLYIKGSQGIRLERAVEAIMAEPENKGEMLVRQDVEWLSR